ncbi:radical SAM protein [Pleionea mediterranea]|uniref:radical SAM protein n=1 Tax=Pleionea mediterranea TaxID=523701 RepID=UPI001FDFB523|nr:radical SAM protein [Pleionea mediterranea]
MSQVIALPYIEPVFRPPSEWKSLILQVTNGCSWNQCTFCDMYTQPQKKFRPKSQEDIDKELAVVAESGTHVGRVFLADGDAMALSFRRLKSILLSIKHYLPNVTRVSSYCLPRNLLNKSVDELTELQQLGLKLVYVGCESGDDTVLSAINKGETYASSLSALVKLKQAQMKTSVMILNGMGGVRFSRQHAVQSAKLMNEAQPNFLSTLVVSYPLGDKRVVEGFKGEYQLPDTKGLLQEMKVLLENLQLESTVFRSDHASNYLALKGILGKDKSKMLSIIDSAIDNAIPLRQEWQRGL